MSSTGILVGSLIAGILHPILGAIVFFGAESPRRARPPTPRGRVAHGGSMAVPVLTPVEPPFVPGKFALSWTDVTVDDAGVLTWGPSRRRTVFPAVDHGPDELSFREALGHGTARYGARVSDCARPRCGLERRTAASGLSASLFLTSAGNETIGVTVTDDDGQSDSASLIVHVSVIPLEDGQQPFGAGGAASTCRST